MTQNDSAYFDVCVIGGGASGAVAAAELVYAGLRVLVLEEGEIRQAPRMGDVEPGWPRAYVVENGIRSNSGRPWSARGMGGGTAFYAGISFRYRHIDFDIGNHVAGDALDPKWPISYDDLRPYYDEIEQRIGVARDDGDPHAPLSPAALMPPHPLSLPGSLLADAGHTIGLRPFPTPLAVNSVPYQGRPSCARLTPCNEYACPTGARADAAAVFLDPHRGADGLSVVAGSRALQLVLAAADRVGWVEWLDLATRTRHRTRVGSVVLAANAVQSSALLLRSAQRFALTGLGNRHDMVGRGLSFKVSGSVEGRLAIPPNRVNRPTGPHSTVAFSNYYVDPDCPTGLGGMMYEASPESRAPVDGRIAVRMHFVAGDQPMRTNRVRLDRDLDQFGVPSIAIDYTTHPVDAERLHYLEKRATEIMVAAGASDVAYLESQYHRGSRHLHGGCRAGDDPADSVVDATGRVHDLANLHVVDGGFFPFAGGVNPTLTIQANALRISRYLSTNLA
ncbi:GMC oxidoreductase [Nocardia sp. NPDC049149]|uniref:GMC oxidoreductase n=1 Tax=Nocardia sp. NPDC049149 TaxID=3364315 RepID=UPI00371F6E6F